jgi:hypothetical protein
MDVDLAFDQRRRHVDRMAAAGRRLRRQEVEIVVDL